MKILVCSLCSLEAETWRLGEESRERVRARVAEAGGKLVFVQEHSSAIREIRDADVLFGYLTPEMLKNATKLKWVQAPRASLDQVRDSEFDHYYIFPELAASDIIVTSRSGIYSEAIATHVFAFITSFARDFPKLLRRQIEHVWDRDVKTIQLCGRTIGIVGLGGVGKEVARVSAAFRMDVIAVDPDPTEVPSCVREIWGPEGLKDLLRESDFVVLCLPDAPGTVNLIGAEQLRSMKTTAYLINTGRGRTVDIDALTGALADGWIAGAGLDVFPPAYEPLPENHPLWPMENVIITPHCSAYGTPPGRGVDVFLENLGRFIDGRTLVNVVDKNRMVVTGPRYEL